MQEKMKERVNLDTIDERCQPAVWVQGGVAAVHHRQ
jgi:hypothetical protein